VPSGSHEVSHAVVLSAQWPAGATGPISPDT
jgi:hypothetical protein